MAAALLVSENLIGSRRVFTISRITWLNIRIVPGYPKISGYLPVAFFSGWIFIQEGHGYDPGYPRPSLPAHASKGLILFSMRSKWEHHYKKRIRSCNEVSITKKKNQVVQWSLHCKKKESGRVPFTDSKWSSVEVEMELRFYHTKSQWSSELYLNSISSQPQHPDSPGLSLQLPARPQQPRHHTMKLFCLFNVPYPQRPH